MEIVKITRPLSNFIAQSIENNISNQLALVRVVILKIQLYIRDVIFQN